jgi:hypothetical protein
MIAGKDIYGTKIEQNGTRTHEYLNFDSEYRFEK